MARESSTFLTAEWRHLAMLNFEVDRRILGPFVPAGTELDLDNGRTVVSLVAFLFLNTRVLGVAVPFHRHFEEVNLRFYVRRKAGNEWRRGVVFVKELVPRRLIAWAARTLYGENYVAFPMGHTIESDDPSKAPPRRVSYWWTCDGRENRVELNLDPATGPIQEEFITEHYWGYARRGDRGTAEYRVEHPRWRVWNAASARLDCDVGALYGDRFVEALQPAPTSAFLADGSKVTVFKGRLLSDVEVDCKPV